MPVEIENFMLQFQESVADKCDNCVESGGLCDKHAAELDQSIEERDSDLEDNND